MKLPRHMPFDDTAYPDLLAVFAEIDAGIAAMVATDPGFQLRSAGNRRSRPMVIAKPGRESSRKASRAA